LRHPFRLLTGLDPHAQGRTLAATDLELLRRSPLSLLSDVNARDDAIVNELQTRSETTLVDSLRQCTVDRTIIAVGLVGTFEATLANLYGWEQPWNALAGVLGGTGRPNLYDQMRDFYDAVNVLKHGRGRSYDRLLERRDVLSFEVKGPREAFFAEGDVSEVPRLVAADNAFVERCSEIIGEIASVIEAY
jgi:hypothetical protein